MPRNPLVGGIFTSGGGGAALRPQLLLVRKTKLLQAPRRESPFGMWIPARLLLPEFVLAERCFLPIRAAFMNTDALFGHGNASCTSPGARKARMGCLGKDVPHSILLRKTTKTNNGRRVRSFTGPCCGGARTAAAVSEPLGVEPPAKNIIEHAKGIVTTDISVVTVEKQRMRGLSSRGQALQRAPASAQRLPVQVPTRAKPARGINGRRPPRDARHRAV